ncbi:RHS repeat domain-containing protein, partial [Facilibium subflavum]|uniref:RHS repeat domain-containing protein n=1 Tax=Facilibium subflavum TaxID=2219058 RepID=UPI0013C35B74
MININLVWVSIPYAQPLTQQNKDFYWHDYQTTMGLSFNKGNSKTNVLLPGADLDYQYALINFPETVGDDGFSLSKYYNNRPSHSHLWSESGWHWQANEPLYITTAKLQQRLAQLKLELKEYSYGEFSAPYLYQGYDMPDLNYKDSFILKGGITKELKNFNQRKNNQQTEGYLKDNLAGSNPPPNPDSHYNYDPKELGYYMSKNVYTVRYYDKSSHTIIFFETKPIKYADPKLREDFLADPLNHVDDKLYIIDAKGNEFIYDKNQGYLLTHIYRANGYHLLFTYIKKAQGKYLLVGIADNYKRSVSIDYPDRLGEGETIITYGNNQQLSYHSVKAFSDHNGSLFSKIVAFTDTRGNKTDVQYAKDKSVIERLDYPSGISERFTYVDEPVGSDYANVLPNGKLVKNYPIVSHRLVSHSYSAIKTTYQHTTTPYAPLLGYRGDYEANEIRKELGDGNTYMPPKIRDSYRESYTWPSVIVQQDHKLMYQQIYSPEVVTGSFALDIFGFNTFKVNARELVSSLVLSVKTPSVIYHGQTTINPDSRLGTSMGLSGQLHYLYHGKLSANQNDQLLLDKFSYHSGHQQKNTTKVYVFDSVMIPKNAVRENAFILSYQNFFDNLLPSLYRTDFTAIEKTDQALITHQEASGLLPAKQTIRFSTDNLPEMISNTNQEESKSVNVLLALNKHSSVKDNEFRPNEVRAFYARELVDKTSEIKNNSSSKSRSINFNHSELKIDYQRVGQDRESKTLSFADLLNHSLGKLKANQVIKNIEQVTNRDKKDVFSQLEIEDSKTGKLVDGQNSMLVNLYTGKPIEITKANGEKYHFNYDAFDQLSTVKSGSQTIDYYYYQVFNKFGYRNLNVITRVWSSGLEESSYYDEYGQAVAQTNNVGTNENLLWHKTYDQYGNVIKYVNEYDQATFYKYDELDRVVQINTPEGDQIDYYYDWQDNSKTTYINQVIKKQTFYDGDGLVIEKRSYITKQKRPVNHSSTYIFAPGDQLNIVRYQYSGSGEIIKEKKQKALLLRKGKAGNQKIKINGNDFTFVSSQSNSYKYGLDNKILSITHKDWQSGKQVKEDLQKFWYDVYNKVTLIKQYRFDQKGNNSLEKQTTYHYDDQDMLSYAEMDFFDKTGIQKLTTEKNYFDENLQVNKTCDVLGHCKQYSYDKEGKLIGWTNESGTYFTIKENKADSFSIFYRETDPISNEIHDIEKVTKYNSSGYITEVRNYRDGEMVGEVSYTYDNAGNLKEKIFPDGKKLSYHYDQYQRKIQQTDVLGNKTYYKYKEGSPDELAEVITYSAKDKLLSSVSVEYDEDPVNLSYGKVTRLDFNNGVVKKLNYNKEGLIENIRYEKDHVPLWEYVYTYSAQQQLSSKLVNPGTFDQVKESYHYNATSQLANVIHESRNAHWQTNYEWDNNNNLTHKTKECLSGTCQSQAWEGVYNQANQLIEARQNGQIIKLNYDERGNRLNDIKGNRYYYNQTNQLIGFLNTTLDQEVLFSYLPGSNMRFNKVIQDNKGNKQSVQFYYDEYAIPRLVNEVGQARKLYHYLGIVPTEVIEDKGDQTQLITLAGLDSADKGIVDNSIKSLANFEFFKEYQDQESQLVYLRNRYYDPLTSSFIQKDMTELLNRYGYADGDPVNLIDPLGLSAQHYQETPNAVEKTEGIRTYSTIQNVLWWTNIALALIPIGIEA